MTLSERNAFFKAGIGFCALCVLLLLVISFLIIPLYQTDIGGERRSGGFFQSLTGYFLNNNYYAVHTSLILTILFSLIGMILIHYYFERTSSPEILYIAIFTMSFSFEIIRLILPMQYIFIFPSFYLRITSRLLLFARLFGIFSLFAAGICAAGLDVQKTRNVLFLIVIATSIITFNVPIDVLNWDTSFNIANGYVSMFKMIELTVILTTMFSFLIASKIRGSKEYIYAAAGSILALTGRSILLNADNWVGPVIGILFLSFGTWFLCSKIHKIHLWL